MMNKKKGTYILAIGAFLIFLVLASACASTSTPSSSSSASASSRQYSTVTLRNETGETIYYLNISERADDEWGPDWLGENVIRNGSSYTVRLVRGEYDVRARNSDRSNTYTFWIKVNSDSHTFEIERSDRR